MGSFPPFQYAHEEILVPGPAVTAATFSNKVLDFGSVLYEELPAYINTNKVNKGDMLATVTHIDSIETIDSGNS